MLPTLNKHCRCREPLVEGFLWSPDLRDKAQGGSQSQLTGNSFSGCVFVLFLLVQYSISEKFFDVITDVKQAMSYELYNLFVTRLNQVVIRAATRIRLGTSISRISAVDPQLRPPAATFWRSVRRAYATSALDDKTK